MISEPKFTISDFSLMSADGGIFYADGFSVKNENGKSIIYEDFISADQIFDDLSGFSVFGTVVSATFTRTLNSGTYFKFLLDNAGYLHSYAEIGSTIFDGTLITPTDLSLSASTKGDLFVFPSGNLLMTMKNYGALGIRGTCKTGSGTTKIIDTDGRDFSTLGLGTSAPNNKVVNMKTGEVYTITSISTTTATNDTLNLSAGTANNEGEDFIAFVGNKFNLDAGITVPTFKGQPSEETWSRQIKQYGDEFVILNGNYLSKIAADESTFDSTYKRLPRNHQGLSFDISSDKYLVSSVSADGSGYILLWDGYNEGWNNILKLDSPTYAVKAYMNGWVFMSNGILYFTDGNQIEKMSEYSDSKSIPSYGLEPKYFNGLTVLNDLIYVAYPTNGNYNRALPGLYVYNKKYGWTYVKCVRNGDEFIPAYSVFVNPRLSSAMIPDPRIEVGGDGTYNYITSTNTSTRKNRSLIYFLDLKQETQVKEIELVLSSDYRTYFDNLGGDKTANITVNIGDGKSGIIGFNETNNTGTTTTVKVDGSVRAGSVGDEIQFYYSTVGGERAYIDSIANAGTNTETWTISPALSTTTPNAAYIRILKLKKTETKTVNMSDLSKPIRFITKGMITDKLFIEVVVNGTSNPFNVNILDVKIY